MVTHLGSGGVVALVSPAHVDAADAVITIGKTVQYALAAACPVFCYDIHGGPGWLTQRNLGTARRHNFSGRPFARMDAAAIARQVLDGYAGALAEASTLGSAISDATWPDALARVFEAAGAAPRRVPTAEGLMRLRGSAQLRRRSARTITTLEGALSESDARHRILEGALSESDARHRILAAQSEHHARQLAVVRDSESWRLTAPCAPPPAR